jgi:pyruvate dehydrogenase E1 component alpha subunit
MSPADLIAFEKQVAEEFEQGGIKGPVHLSGGNEEELIRVFKEISCGDWVFSTWRNHYHALLHGIPADKVLAEIRAGRSMNLTLPEHRFYSSAIVGGIVSIATGVSAALKRNGCGRKVWCFVGDMAATTGAFHEASQYATRQGLPIRFVIEDIGVSTNTPTNECWGGLFTLNTTRYQSKRTHPHVGTGKWVTF